MEGFGGGGLASAGQPGVTGKAREQKGEKWQNSGSGRPLPALPEPGPCRPLTGRERERDEKKEEKRGLFAHIKCYLHSQQLIGTVVRSMVRDAVSPLGPSVRAEASPRISGKGV